MIRIQIGMPDQMIDTSNIGWAERWWQSLLYLQKTSSKNRSIWCGKQDFLMKICYKKTTNIRTIFATEIILSVIFIYIIYILYGFHRKAINVHFRLFVNRVSSTKECSRYSQCPEKYWGLVLLFWIFNEFFKSYFVNCQLLYTICIY